MDNGLHADKLAGWKVDKSASLAACQTTELKVLNYVENHEKSRSNQEAENKVLDSRLLQRV